MIKEVYATEETVALAKAKALEMLGVGEEFVDFEVMQFPEKKKLGIFGGKMAQVKGVLKLLPGEKAVEFLKELFFYMGMENLEVKIVSEDSEVCNINISGEDATYLIGYHGETLDALQYLTGFVANKNFEGKNFCMIRLEAADYRKNRKLSLEKLARSVATKVAFSGRRHKEIPLRPMRSYERRIVHEAVKSIPNVYSWSEGDGKERYVVISSSKRTERNLGNF